MSILKKFHARVRHNILPSQTLCYSQEHPHSWFAVCSFPTESVPRDDQILCHHDTCMLAASTPGLSHHQGSTEIQSVTVKMIYNMGVTV